MREAGNEIGGLMQLNAGLGADQAALRKIVTMKAHHHPVGLATRLTDRAQIVGDVGCIADAGCLKSVATQDALAEELHFAGTLGGRLTLAVEMPAVARPRLLEAEFVAHSHKGIEGCNIDRVGGARRER